MLNKAQDAIRDMFDDIAVTYDKVNRILSFGLDEGWRKRVADLIPKTEGISVLDVATGTAELLIELCAFCPNIKKAIGVDISEKMLSIGKEKVRHKNLSNQISLIHGDARKLPFSDESFDIVTIAFGIRNVPEFESALREFARVLKHEGELIILEFSLPENRVIRKLFLVYFRYILPLVGGLLSRYRGAYRYLNKSVEAFPSGQEFKRALLNNGFNHVSVSPITFGIATIYCARKR